MLISKPELFSFSIENEFGFIVIMIALIFIPAYHAIKFGDRIVAFQPSGRPTNLPLQVNPNRGLQPPISTPNFTQYIISKHLVTTLPYKEDQIMVATMRPGMPLHL